MYVVSPRKHPVPSDEDRAPCTVMASESIRFIRHQFVRIIADPTRGLIDVQHGPLARYLKFAGCACTGNAGNVFPATAG